MKANLRPTTKQASLPSWDWIERRLADFILAPQQSRLRARTPLLRLLLGDSKAPYRRKPRRY